MKVFFLFLFLIQDDNRIRNVLSKINSDTYVLDFFCKP